MKIDLLYLAMKAQRTIDKARSDARQFIEDKFKQFPKRFDIATHSDEVSRILNTPGIDDSIKEMFRIVNDERIGRTNKDSI